MLATCVIPGCAGSSVPRTPASTVSGPSEVTLQADWDDVRPAVTVALGQVGIAALRADVSVPGRVQYDLLTAYDEPGALTIERLGEPEDPDPVSIRVHASIGRFGDGPRENELVTRVAERLEQLRGVEVAPVKR